MYINDDGTGLTVGLEEVVFADVHDGVANFGHGNIVKCTVVIDVDAFARGNDEASERCCVRSGVASERVESERCTWLWKRKFDARVLWVGSSIFCEKLGIISGENG